MTMTTITPTMWIPYPNTLTHAGTPISEGPQDIEFFAAPPADIGQIQSVSSTLTRAKQPPPAVLKIILPILVFLVCTVLAILLWFASPIFTLFMFAAGIGLAIWIYCLLNFMHQCSFVGDQGIAYYIINGSRTSPVKEEKLLFKDVTALYTQQTRNYVNGVYTGTDYHYTFNKFQDKPHKINGNYNDNKKWSYNNDRWFFASAAEYAWTTYFLHYVNQQFRQIGYVEFAMAGNPKAVRVGEGYLEFITSDNTTAYVAVADMKKTSLANGFFYFEHKDSTWWQGKGKYSFAYGNLPNARAFLICLDQLAGIRWS